MTFDWKKPDYAGVHAERAALLAQMRARPELLPSLREYYRTRIAEFIDTFGVTSDPRLIARGLPSEVPFKLFPKQRELIGFFEERLRKGESGLVEKVRDFGVTWLVVAYFAAKCLLEPGFVAGIGSRKEDALDRAGDPSTIFWKIRFFIENLPPEFRGDWDAAKNSAHCRVTFANGSSITGESGDQIGRGGRTTATAIDESAFLERAELVERSLASNTNTRLDISTPNGRANAFAIKRWSGRVPVFTARWQDDPRKDQAWFDRQVATLDPVTLAQEVLLSYDASVEGILLPHEWVGAAVGARAKLGIPPSGTRRAALDVADEGKDKCAFAGRRGIELEHLEVWSGRNGDIFKTTVRAAGICETRGYPDFDYDADGLGSACRGDMVVINEDRREAGKPEILAEPFRGSAAVHDPEGSLVEGRTNRDFFANLKAMSWWHLRLLFQQTYRAVVEGMPCDPDGIISIDPRLPELNQLISELSQPTYSINTAGKVVVDKTPDGAMSPNCADAVMMVYSPYRTVGYFSGRSPAAAQPVPRAAEPLLPETGDIVYGVMTVAGDVAAVVHFSAGYHASGCGCFILDYDVRVLGGGDAATWARVCVRRLRELGDRVLGVDRTGRRPPPAFFIDDHDQGYLELLRQRGVEFQPVRDDLPEPATRLNKAQAFLRERHARPSRLALERAVEFRDQRRNFLRDVLTQDSPSEEDPLAMSVATGVLITLWGRRRISDPATSGESRPPLAPDPRVAAWVAARADWDRRAAEATARIRARLGDPSWQPLSLLALGIGAPPPRP